MPRQRISHTRRTYVFPEDFPQRLEQFKGASGLTWSELARRLGTCSYTVRRWRAGIQPSPQHLMALFDLADSLGLGHLLALQSR